MGNIARKFINGVQQTMLDRLAIRLLPVLWLFTLWENLAPRESGPVSLILLLGVLGVLFGCWTLGAVADTAPPPRRRSPYDQLHETPPAGFSAWDQLPDKNLNPPAFMRRLVRTIGAGPDNRGITFEVLLFISAVALAWLLSRRPADFWADIHPALGAQSAREALFLAASAVVLFLCVRSWATEQRRRLEPAPVRYGSGFGIFLFLLASGAFMGMVFSDLLGYGLLPGVIGGTVLVILGAVVPWRSRFLDILFGKRASSTGNAE